MGLHMGRTLAGQTLGVIGCGRIGRRVMELAQAFGMQVICHDPALPASMPLPQLLRTADIISLHCPLTEETYHMIDASALEQCKKGMVLINTSRGALVDAEALLAGIKSRKVGAACLDVYEEESDLFFEDNSGHILEDDTLARLISMPNVIVTSHQAFLTEDALRSIAETTVRNLVDFARLGQSPNELCYRAGSTSDCRDGKCFS